MEDKIKDDDVGIKIKDIISILKTLRATIILIIFFGLGGYTISNFIKNNELKFVKQDLKIEYMEKLNEEKYKCQKEIQSLTNKRNEELSTLIRNLETKFSQNEK